MNNTDFDIIIIGGGIAGLYAAYQIKKTSPNMRTCILEKQSKKYMGGRTGNDIFKGTSVVTGAGVGRKKKDKLLVELLNEMNITTSEFEASNSYADTISPQCDVKKTFLKIKRAYNDSVKPQTFKEFATKILGESEYRRFVVCSAYGDYENENIYDTLFNYGFNDNYNKWTGLYIPWHDLIDKMVHEIGEHNIKFKHSVESITQNGEKYKISTKSENFTCKKLIIATTIDSLLKLLPDQTNIYKQIKGQPFLRTYGKFSKSSISIMKQYLPSTTVVPGPLQRIIPMNPDAGVYMIAYCDNTNAVKLNKLSEDNKESRSKFCKILEISLGIPNGSLKLLAIKNYFWPVGTHYYTPLSEEFDNREEFIKIAQRPEKNIRIVGELISTNQGWVEGALESVKSVITKKWINEI
jgi:hypothetical protein